MAKIRLSHPIHHDLSSASPIYIYGTRTLSSLRLKMAYHLTVLGHQQAQWWQQTYTCFLHCFTGYQWFSSLCGSDNTVQIGRSYVMAVQVIITIPGTYCLTFHKGLCRAPCCNESSARITKSYLPHHIHNGQQNCNSFHFKSTNKQNVNNKENILSMNITKHFIITNGKLCKLTWLTNIIKWIDL